MRRWVNVDEFDVLRSAGCRDIVATAMCPHAHCFRFGAVHLTLRTDHKHGNYQSVTVKVIVPRGKTAMLVLDPGAGLQEAGEANAGKGEDSESPTTAE